MVHLAKLNFSGDSNIGLYAVATDKFVLIGKKLNKAKQSKLEEIFGVPVISIKIYNTDMVGVYICANSNNVLVPNIIRKEELTDIKKKLDGLAKVHILKTELNAHGNNRLTNEIIEIINKEYPKSKAVEIAKLLGVKVKLGLKHLYPMLPGAAAVLTNHGAILPPEVPEDEILKIEKQLGFEVGTGTISMGSHMIGSGVVANSNGFIVSSTSSGYEIVRVDESLNF